MKKLYIATSPEIGTKIGVSSRPVQRMNELDDRVAAFKRWLAAFLKGDIR